MSPDSKNLEWKNTFATGITIQFQYVITQHVMSSAPEATSETEAKTNGTAGGGRAAWGTQPVIRGHLPMLTDRLCTGEGEHLTRRVTGGPCCILELTQGFISTIIQLKKK